MNEFWGAFSNPGDDIIRNNSSHFDALRSRLQHENHIIIDRLLVQYCDVDAVAQVFFFLSTMFSF